MLSRLHYSRLPTIHLALVLLTGCCWRERAPYVAVREAQFRIEETKQDRLALPLDDSSINRIHQFLLAGGIRTGGDEIADIRDPGAPDRYKNLLAYLREPNLTLSNLETNKTLQLWFKGSPVTQVVDARESKPVFPRPIALGDGVYWWVFYPDLAGHVRNLLIVRSRLDSPRR